jgi:predicted nucleic acid-binding protein
MDGDDSRCPSIIVIHLDTNFLVNCLLPGRPAESQLLAWITGGESIGISVVAWSEFLCGPATEEERMFATMIVGAPEPLLAVDAEKAAELFNLTGRRSRSLADCQIAAIAMRVNAAISTSNTADFKPFLQFGLKLASVAF